MTDYENSVSVEGSVNCHDLLLILNSIARPLAIECLQMKMSNMVFDQTWDQLGHHVHRQCIDDLR